MKTAFATLLALASSAAASPIVVDPKQIGRIGIPVPMLEVGGPEKFSGRLSADVEKRIAPVAAGIFGVAAGSVASAVLTGATKGVTSGSVRGTLNKIFGPTKKRSVAEDKDEWTFGDVRELFAESAVEDLIEDVATPEEAAVCVSVAYEVGGDDSQVREATSVQLNSKTDNETVSFDCFLLAAPLNFTVAAELVNSTTVAVNPGPGKWENGVLAF